MSAVNPKILSDTNTAQATTIRAADSVTWKKGQIGYLTSGTVTPISSATGGTTAPYFMFAEDQTASTSSSDVKVIQLLPGCELEVYVTNNGTAAAIGVANRGTAYGLYTASNVTYLDVNVTSGADWQVKRLAAEYEPVKNAAADSPGKCVIVLL